MIQRENIGFDNSVFEPIDHGINSVAERMLMIVSIDIWRNGCSMWIRLIRTNIDLKNSSETNIDLYSPILIKVVVPNVFCFGRESELGIIE